MQSVGDVEGSDKLYKTVVEVADGETRQVSIITLLLLSTRSFCMHAHLQARHCATVMRI